MKNRLKTLYRLAASGLALGLFSNLPHYLLPAHAFPSNSPSARAAVRLKYHPPDNWIRHYLGDDRYKIAGGIWDVVSTQLDTYYHRPNCPNMLRQPAGITIGFADWNEAEEGGYVPDPFCSPQSAQVAYTVVVASSNNSSTTINRTGRAIRIVLADGKSTVLLPPSWKRTRSGAQTIVGYAVQSDTLQPLQGKGSLRFAFNNTPDGSSAEPFLTTQAFPKLVLLANRRSTNPQALTYLKTARIASGRLGGRSGVLLTSQSSASGGDIRGRVTVIARGSKMYVLEDNSNGNAGGKIVVNSFQPR
jgi:hypothetical protein